MLPAIAARLGVSEAQILRHAVARRGNDARRKNAIQLVYAVDVTLSDADEAEVLARLAGDTHVRPRPIPAIAFRSVRQKAGPRAKANARWSSAPARAACSPG
jgi:uncharacterized FAD-dependent dehydrogenase